MSLFKNLTLRRYFPIALLACLIVAVALVKLQPKMQHEPSAGLITPVNVIEVKAYEVRPAIRGFGTVEPDILLDAKAEISGKIIYVHPQLRNGSILMKDIVIMRIEPDDYQLALQQAQATVASHQAKIREIHLQESNLRADLAIVKKKIKLVKLELSRIQSLARKQSVSKSSRDSQQVKVLQLQQELQHLNNQLITLPEQLANAKANLENSLALVNTQQRNLDRTVITLPFNARISKLSVDENQYINKGALLYSAQTTDKILINAQFALQHFRMLAKDFQGQEALLREAFTSGFTVDTFKQLGLSAKVRLASNDSPFWQANVERISSQLDPDTRTLGVIVSVDNPYTQIIPGTKPPLMRGMFTEIILQGKAKTFYVLPRDALHENQIFIVNKHNQLERRPVENAQIQGKMVLLSTGLQQGEMLIVSDVFPAIPGMQVQTTLETALQQSIADWAKEQ
ncbi:efflux RND transporter periplasmic adaptor subunit [Methyloprofundus sp.]|uniref:efflux RND transporter periplasmic adaptor subunit n=1 Tax=Methyloprofundus sp. TaxID=2020875 RepID=UPI003D1265FF